MPPFGFGAQNGPKMHQKPARSRKSASGGGAGSDFYRSLLSSLFEATPRTDSWRGRPFKIVLFPQWEHDFDKITVFEKTPKK